MDIVRVALDVPLATAFDYAWTASVAPIAGARVVVPFGRSSRIGVIVAVGGQPAVEKGRIKTVARIFPAEPPLPGDVLALAQFASRYYRHPLGQVLIGALPRALRRVTREQETANRLLALATTTKRIDLDALPARALVQRRVVSHLLEHGPVRESVLRALAPAAVRALAQLRQRGWIEGVETTAPAPVSDWSAIATTSSGPTLSPEQQSVSAAIGAGLGAFGVLLLRGVTGSGKTEVYTEAIAECLRGGRQALVLVPEINLTPQLTERFRRRFPGARLAILHSALADGERVREWRAAQAGDVDIVIGTRLAVFTPAPRLGLIVVDEEHDASFKQIEGLRYSARDLAVMRAKQRGVPVVLGSATPSLESYAQSIAGRYALLELPERPAAAVPLIQCVDTRDAPLQNGLSPALLSGIELRLARREQSLVFVNRRGFAPALVCPACGWAAGCPRCSARLVLHLRQGHLRCHYCGHNEAIAHACGACGNVDLRPAGHGTQRVEEALERAFPRAQVLRVDRDSTRPRGAFASMQARVHRNEVDILVGTQMLAKGHDFPRLTLVGVINADSALYSADLRATERLYALLTQVAGRAGRAHLAGEVLIQTAFPHHPLYEAVVRQDYPGFARILLEERRAAGFPPFAHQALLRADAHSREVVDEFLQRAANAARGLRAGIEVFDPAPAPVSRIAGKERGHLLVQAAARSDLQHFLDAWHAALVALEERRVRWALDVDPIEL